MNAEVFIDTNVFLYALSDLREEQAKAERARQILLNENWAWSVQVAGEFYHVATSPRRQFQLPHSVALEYVTTWLNFPTAWLSPATVIKAIEIRDRFQIQLLGCCRHRCSAGIGLPKGVSEDFSSGQDYDGVKVLNPFLSSPVN